jgi:hypothetical protein
MNRGCFLCVRRASAVLQSARRSQLETRRTQRFMAPLLEACLVTAFHEPAIPLCNLLLHLQQKVVVLRFMVPMRGSQTEEAFHEPPHRFGDDRRFRLSSSPIPGRR